MTQTDFGAMDDGAAVSLFTIAHPSGIQASVTNLGATLVSLQVPDRNGSMGEVVLVLPRAEDYLRHAGSYFGATVGRFANRIEGGRFSLDARDYQLNTNNAPGGIPCHLHGGQRGFHRQLKPCDRTPFVSATAQPAGRKVIRGISRLPLPTKSDRAGC